MKWFTSASPGGAGFGILGCVALVRCRFTRILQRGCQFFGAGIDIRRLGFEILCSGFEIRGVRSQIRGRVSQILGP